MLGDERVTSTAPMDRTSGGEPDCAWCNQLEKARKQEVEAAGARCSGRVVMCS